MLCNISPRWRVTGIVNILPDEVENLLLSLCELFHSRHSVYIYSVVSIYSCAADASEVSRQPAQVWRILGAERRWKGMRVLFQTKKSAWVPVS